MSVAGVSIMYKVQVLGPQNVLHKYEPFLLNTPICLLVSDLKITYGCVCSDQRVSMKMSPFSFAIF